MNIVGIGCRVRPAPPSPPFPTRDHLHAHLHDAPYPPRVTGHFTAIGTPCDNAQKMNNYHPSPQTRALRILEILGLVLSFVDKPTARRCSLVCRLWKEPALNAYWARLDGESDFDERLLLTLLPQRTPRMCERTRWGRQQFVCNPTMILSSSFLSNARSPYFVALA